MSEEIEVTLFWGRGCDRTALLTKHVPRGSTLRVGEGNGCELSVPDYAMGIEALDLVEYRGGEVVINPPPRARVFLNRSSRRSVPFVPAHGEVIDLEMGPLSLRILIGEAEVKIQRGSPLDESAWGSVGLSAVAHAAMLAALAFFMPSLGQADEVGVDRAQILTMKTYLDAAADRERDVRPPEHRQTDPTGPSPPPDVHGRSDKRRDKRRDVGGRAAKGADVAMGSAKPVAVPGYWMARGSQRENDPQLAREQALTEAREFGMIGLIASAQRSASDAPVVPWGSVLAGVGKESHVGNLWAGEIGDAMGIGLGLSGVGEGGNGKGEGIGIDGLGVYGLAGTCPPGTVCNGQGTGGGHGRLRGEHVGHVPSVRTGGDLVVGRLDAAVIQRIVRQNSGRMLNCYEEGLRTNPGLAGRVAVQFVIDRTGEVTLSQDSVGSDLADASVRQCVVRTFYNISFPEPKGGIVTVIYPLTFSPTD